MLEPRTTKHPWTRGSRSLAAAHDQAHAESNRPALRLPLRAVPICPLAPTEAYITSVSFPLIRFRDVNPLREKSKERTKNDLRSVSSVCWSHSGSDSAPRCPAALGRSRECNSWLKTVFYTTFPKQNLLSWQCCTDTRWFGNSCKAFTKDKAKTNN